MHIRYAQDRSEAFPVVCPAANQRLLAWLLLAAASGAILLTGCGTKPSPGDSAAAIRPTGPLPVDLVFCIDNSGSIQGAERVLVRETVMLLADLAEKGDRISLITFGSAARQVSSVDLQRDADKRHFREQVEKGLTFGEGHSDLAAGIRLAGDKRDVLFRPARQSARALVVLSDGRLEPVGRSITQAFQQIREDLAGPLADVPVYGVALGDSAANQPIAGLDIDGKTLMERHITRPPGRFFHARKLEELLGIAVLILNAVKEVSSLAAPGEAAFNTDTTVEAVTLIVRKRTTVGPLCRTEDIQLMREGGPSATFRDRQALADLLYWNNQYEYFDLLIVRQPPAGRWQVRLTDGKLAQVSTTIKTPIELKYRVPPAVFLNEAATLGAWLFDRAQGAVSKERYEIQAHLASDGRLERSNTYVVLTPDAASGQYFMDVPSRLYESLRLDEKERKVTAELIATKSGDDWFIRRSAPFTIELREPFAQWTVQPQRLVKIPFRSLRLTFEAVVNTGHKHYPPFEVPPKVKVGLERLEGDVASERWQQTLEASPRGKAFLYRTDHAPSAISSYRYRYRLEGNTRQGPLVIESPYYGFTVQRAWGYLGVATFLLLLIAEVISRRTAKLKGRLEMNAPIQHSARLPRRRLFDGGRLAPELKGGFTLEARREFFFRKYVLLTMCPEGGRRPRQKKLGVGRHPTAFYCGEVEYDFDLIINR